MTEDKEPLKYRYFWLALGCAYVVFVVWVSLTSSPPGQNLPVNDKLAHWLMYFMLMLWFLQLSDSFEERATLAAAFIFMGLALEFMQGLEGPRTKDLGDGLANTLGVLAAVPLARTPAARMLYRVERSLEQWGESRE